MNFLIVCLVGMGVLAACMTSVVWAEPLGNSNFSRLLRARPAGDFELIEDINLAQPEGQVSHSPWEPIEFFNGTLEGNGYAIYGLNIQESDHNTTSGLFRRQYGDINLMFVDPEIVATGNGTWQGLVAGENSGNVTVVWQGGRMEHKGIRTGSSSKDHRGPFLGVVGQNSAKGRVEVLARAVSQTVTGGRAFVGIGAGRNYGTTQVVAQAVNQTVRGDGIHIGIGAGINDGISQAVAQFVKQVAVGDAANIGMGAGYNSGISQGVAQSVNQVAIGNEAGIGIGAGLNNGTSQAVVQSVIQVVEGHEIGGIGISAGIRMDWSTTEAVVIDDFLFRYRAGTRLTEQQAKNTTRTKEILSARPRDWNYGNNSQYPMLRGLDGGFQDMRRLSPEFMRDYALPSNNRIASWFGPDILKALNLILIGKPLYQVLAPDGHFYVVTYQEATQSLLLTRYDAQCEWDRNFGDPACWHQQNLMQGLENSTIESGVLHEDTLYLAVNDSNSQSRLLALPLGGGLMREFNIPADVYGLQVWGNRLYLTGKEDQFFLSRKGLPLTEFSVRAGISNSNQDVGYCLLINADNTLYVAGERGHDFMVRQLQVAGLQPVQSFGDNGLVLDPVFDQLAEPGTDGSASRGRAMVLRGGMLYVAGNLKTGSGEDLFIRRYNLSGEVDEDFMVMVATGLNESGLDNLEHEVYLLDTGAYLTVVKRVLDDNQAYIASVDWDSGDIVDVQQPVFDGIASARGLGLSPDGQLRMAVYQNGQVMVEQHNLFLPTPMPGMTTFLDNGTNSTDYTPDTQGDPDWLWPMVGGVAGTVATVAAVTGIIVGTVWLARRYLPWHSDNSAYATLPEFPPQTPIYETLPLNSPTP